MDAAGFPAGVVRMSGGTTFASAIRKDDFRGQCFYCLNGAHSQCGGALGGWRFGNTINGAWAEYLLVCPDIFSAWLSGAESSNIRVGGSADRVNASRSSALLVQRAGRDSLSWTSRGD